MQCDMCGKDSQGLFLVNTEGVELNVCKECSRYGKIIKRPKRPNFHNKKRSFKPIKKEPETEKIETIATDYASIIKTAREKTGLKHIELARKIAEKESLIASIESGKTEPSIKLAKQLERALDIKIIEIKEIKAEPKDKKVSKNGPVTIGDVINITKRTR